MSTLLVDMKPSGRIFWRFHARVPRKISGVFWRVLGLRGVVMSVNVALMARETALGAFLEHNT